MQRIFLGLLLAALALPGLAQPALGAETLFQGRSDGGRDFSVRFMADPLRTMRPTPFRIALSAPGGQPLTRAELSCELTMPAMPMPDNRPAVTAEEADYSGEAVFTMAGEWRMACTVESPGGPRDAFAIAIPRVLLK